MAADNILEILAEANFGPLTAATEEAAGVQQQATQNMQSAWQRLWQATQSAAAGISSSVKGAAVSVTESTTVMREDFVATAEAAKLSAFGVGSAFGAMGALLGAGLAFEFIDHLKESVLQMGHLSEATGIEIGRLAEWKAALNEAGVNSDRFSQTMTRLSSNMTAAADGDKTAAEHFRQLGINVEEWAGKIPPADTVLLQIAEHMVTSGAKTRDLGNAYKLLGRNSQELVAYLHQGKEAIEQQLRSHQALAEETRKSEQAAKDMQRQEAELSEKLTQVALPVFRAIVTVLQLIEGGFIKWEAAAKMAGEFIESWVRAVLAGLYQVGQAVDAVRSGHFEKLPIIAARAAMDMAKEIQTGADKANAIWDAANKEVDALFVHTAESVKTTMGDITKTHEQTAAEILRVWEHEEKTRADLETSMHKFSLQQELEFWKEKLKAAQGNGKLMAEVQDKISDLDQKIAAEDLRVFIENQRTKEAAAKKGSEARVTAEQAILDEMKKRGAEAEAIAAQETRLATATAALAAEAAKEAKASDEDRFKSAMVWIEATDKAGEQDLARKRERLNTEVELGRITGAQKVAIEKALLQQEFDAEKESIARKVELYKATHHQGPENPNYLSDLDKFNSQILVLKSKLNKDLEKVDDGLLKDEKKKWDAHFKFLTSAYSKFLSGVVTGHLNMKQALASIGSAILQQAIDYLAQEMTQITAHLAAKLGLKKAFDAIESAMHKAGLIEKAATEKTAAVGTITTDAAMAFAGAMAWWSAVDPINAPEFAAAASTITLGALPAISAAGGAFLDKDTVVQAHAKETVLPAHLSEGFQDIIAEKKGGKGGGDVHLHYSPSVQALDGPGVAKVVKGHAHDIAKIVMAEMRDMQ